MIGWTKYYIYLLRRRIRGAHTNVVLALEHMGLGALIISLYDTRSTVLGQVLP